MKRGMLRLRNFHLPLPEALYRRLSEEAQAVNQPATVVARHAIDQWLRQRKKTVLREAIAAYATAAAGSLDDLDPELESASLEQWTGPRRPRSRRR